MTVAYKPTHDSNIDIAYSTSFVVLFFSHSSGRTCTRRLKYCGILYLVGQRRYPATAVPPAANRRGRGHHDTLSLCAGQLPGDVYPKLDLEVYRGPLRRHLALCGDRADAALVRYLLDLLFQGREGEEVHIAV